jgi:C4-dicarboxylate transporter, DctM subunit
VSAEVAIVITVILLLVLLVIETPVWVALAASGTLGLVLLHGTGFAAATLGSVPFTSVFSFTLSIVPMYILIGILAVHGRIAEQVFTIFSYVFQRVPGGLGCATVAACAGFAAVSGSSVATAATMARLSIDQMVRYGYSPSFASAIVASAGTLGVMIPPSIILVFYSVITGESTARMLAAGIVPGLLSAGTYMTYILIQGRRQLKGIRYAVVNGETVIHADGLSPRQSLAELRALPWRGLFRVLVIFTIVMGGISTGVFTPTESGALGALVAMVMMLWERRREPRRARWRSIADALKGSAQTTSMVFAILVGSLTYTAFMVSSGVPRELTDWVVGLDVPPTVVVLGLLLLFIPLGMALEGLSILVITMPLMYPIVTGLGFDGVWFGIMATKMIELGLITPPVGMTVYVVAGSTKSVSVEQAFRGVGPFVGMDLLNIAILFLVPGLVLWLPTTLYG